MTWLSSLRYITGAHVPLHGAIKNNHKCLIILLASDQGHNEIVKMFETKGIDINVKIFICFYRFHFSYLIFYNNPWKKCSYALRLYQDPQ